MSYIATFYTHFGAMSFRKKMKSMGDDKAEMMPGPRALSSSCGTCVRFFMEVEPAAVAEEDMERIVREEENGSFTVLYENEM